MLVPLRRIVLRLAGTVIFAGGMLLAIAVFGCGTVIVHRAPLVLVPLAAASQGVSHSIDKRHLNPFRRCGSWTGERFVHRPPMNVPRRGVDAGDDTDLRSHRATPGHGRLRKRCDGSDFQIEAAPTPRRASSRLMRVLMDRPVPWRIRRVAVRGVARRKRQAVASTRRAWRRREPRSRARSPR